MESIEYHAKKFGISFVGNQEPWEVLSSVIPSVFSKAHPYGDILMVEFEMWGRQEAGAVTTILRDSWGPEVRLSTCEAREAPDLWLEGKNLPATVAASQDCRPPDLALRWARVAPAPLSPSPFPPYPPNPPPGGSGNFQYHRPYPPLSGATRSNPWATAYSSFSNLTINHFLATFQDRF